MVETVAKHGTWSGVFGRRSKDVKEIAEHIRALVIGLHPDAVEVPRNKDKTVAYGFGEKKLSEGYCYLAPQRGHLSVGFWWGAMLEDPNGMLEGKGKKLRHVKISDTVTAKSAKVAQLVHLAIEERRTGLAVPTKPSPAKRTKASKKPRKKKKETA